MKCAPARRLRSSALNPIGSRTPDRCRQPSCSLRSAGGSRASSGKMRDRFSEREWDKSKSLPAAPFRGRNRGGNFSTRVTHILARTPSDPDDFLRTRAFHESFANSLPFGGEDTIFSARAGKFQNYEDPASNGNFVSRLKSMTFLPLSTATLLTRACPLI